MTTIALNSALSGLKAAQKALDVVANNVSNASTDGYTRKILPQASLVIQGEGRGVVPGAITRNVDKALLRDLFIQIGVSQNYAVTDKYLGRIQDLHGASESKQSIAAGISLLAQAFSDLSTSPDDILLTNKAMNAAQQLVSKFNKFSELVTQMRNEAEAEISDSIVTVNAALDTIAEMNARIGALKASGGSTADLEDQRDAAVRTVSQYLETSSFDAENGKIVVMTRQGQVLADETAHHLSLTRNNILPTSYYPGGGVDGLFVGGVDITDSAPGGAIGALLDLRDNTLPVYQAQMDELAQKLAYRFDQQGLRLFTDPSGNVPPNVADPGLVGYVGFSGQIRVNAQVLADTSLIRSGTNGNTVLAGSNEVIRKIADFAFGPYAYEQAQGTVDISAGTIFASAALQQSARAIGDATITVAPFSPSLDSHPDIAAGAQFQITLGGVPHVITIGAGDSAVDLVNTINTVVGAPVASLNGLGQLSVSYTDTIAFDDVTIGTAGLSALGFPPDPAYPLVVNPQNPRFTVQVGTQQPVTIEIAPTDTQTELLAALNAVAGLTATLGGGGELVLTPDEGGDIRLTDGAGGPLAALGVTVSSVAHEVFRQNNLGPDGTLSTGLLASSTLEHFGRSIITSHSETARTVRDSAAQETAYMNTLNKRSLDQSGVNIDQELAEMIRIQANYAAAAKMITASERMLDDLMEAFL